MLNDPRTEPTVGQIGAWAMRRRVLFLYADDRPHPGQYHREYRRMGEPLPPTYRVPVMVSPARARSSGELSTPCVTFELRWWVPVPELNAEPVPVYIERTP